MSSPSRQSEEPTASLIVPCAGAGSRFGAPYAKELHRLGGGSLIDKALAPFLDWAQRSSTRLRLLVPVGEDRGMTLRHLYAYRDAAEILFVYQRDTATGLMGAVEAALPHVVGPTALVLPDQFFDWNAESNPVAKLAEVWKAGIGVLTAAIDSSSLGDEGAVRIDHGAEPGTQSIMAACESPEEDRTHYNAAWVVIGCAPDRRSALLDVVGGRGPSPLVGARSVPVTGYVNASTPDVVR